MKRFLCTFFLKRKHYVFIRGESGHFLSMFIKNISQEKTWKLTETVIGLKRN